jgi:hypothetical protein
MISVKHKVVKKITLVIRSMHISSSSISHLNGIKSNKSCRQVRQIVQCNESRGYSFIAEFAKSIADHWLFPSNEDYTGSAMALMRLQDTYAISSSQLANGEISATYKSKRLNGQLTDRQTIELNTMSLTALECYDLGRVAYLHGDFYHTLMWMQEALLHLNVERTNQSVNKVDILDHLAYATSQVHEQQ